MAITITQERKRQRYLILALVAMIFIILGLLWFRFFGGQEAVVSPVPESSVYALPKVSIEWQLLDNVGSISSQPFRAINAFGGDFGRENPFIPY